MMHKYWGRKPHNVINAYIKNYTKKGEVVLDPFMGSGVVIIESMKESRVAYGIDLNPLSMFITENTLLPADLEGLENSFHKIYTKVHTEFSKLYTTKCPECKANSELLNSIFDGDELVLVKCNCNHCGVSKKKADDYDFQQIKKSESLFRKADKNGNLEYPKDEILQYVKRSKKTHIDQLFTKRALIILSNLRSEILKEKDVRIRDLLMLCFSSMLPNASVMIPGDMNTVNGKSGWVISKLWAPKVHTEKNVFVCFLSRFKKIKKGKEETNQLIQSKDYKLFNQSSEYLKEITSNSIDYIFTDPPYGESISYFGLSMFYNSWLKSAVDYQNEIIFNP